MPSSSRTIQHAKFFFDNSIPRPFVKALGVLEREEIELVHLRDKFNQDVTDPDWLYTLGAEGGWVVISGDYRIAKGKAQRATWRESGFPFGLDPAQLLEAS